MNPVNKVVYAKSPLKHCFFIGESISIHRGNWDPRRVLILSNDSGRIDIMYGVACDHLSNNFFIKKLTREFYYHSAGIKEHHEQRLSGGVIVCQTFLLD